MSTTLYNGNKQISGSTTADVTAIKNNLTSGANSFKFGVDASGNYGYYKNGAVVPFTKVADSYMAYDAQVYCINNSRANAPSGVFIDVADISGICIYCQNQGGATSYILGTTGTFNHCTSSQDNRWAYLTQASMDTDPTVQLASYTNSKTDTTNNWGKIIDVTQYKTMIVVGGGNWGGFKIGTTDGKPILRMYAYSSSGIHSPNTTTYCAVCFRMPAGYNQFVYHDHSSNKTILVDQHREFRTGASNYSKCTGHQVTAATTPKLETVRPDFHYGRYFWLATSSSSANNTVSCDIRIY